MRHNYLIHKDIFNDIIHSPPPTETLEEVPRQRLAELDSFLIKRVDIPDKALKDNFRLVDGKKCAERPRAGSFGKQ